MTITLNDEESRDYIKAQEAANRIGIPFGAFVAKAIDYKVKIKSRDAVIANLKAVVKDLKEAAAVTVVVPEKPVATIPDLYAAQKQIQKEEEAAHRGGAAAVSGLDVLLGKSDPVSVVVNPAPKVEAKPEKLKSRLSKDDQTALDMLANGKIKSACGIEQFALKRSLRPKTVMTYIAKHSNGAYTTVLGRDIKKSDIWTGASIYADTLYFTVKK